MIIHDSRTTQTPAVPTRASLGQPTCPTMSVVVWLRQCWRWRSNASWCSPSVTHAPRGRRVSSRGTTFTTRLTPEHTLSMWWHFESTSLFFADSEPLWLVFVHLPSSIGHFVSTFSLYSPLNLFTTYFTLKLFTTYSPVKLFTDLVKLYRYDLWVVKMRLPVVGCTRRPEKGFLMQFLKIILSESTRSRAFIFVK